MLCKVGKVGGEGRDKSKQHREWRDARLGRIGIQVGLFDFQNVILGICAEQQRVLAWYAERVIVLEAELAVVV